MRSNNATIVVGAQQYWNSCIYTFTMFASQLVTDAREENITPLNQLVQSVKCFSDSGNES